MWVIEILYFIYILIRLRLEIPFYSQEQYRENVTNWCRRLMKRYNTKIYVRGKPQPGFLVPNHTSYLDPVLVLALKAGGAVAKREIKDYLLFGPIGQKLGVLWVKREKKKSRSSVIDQLNNWDAVNKPLWIFPEGTTSPFGELYPFKMGVFKAVENSGMPIQPLVFCFDNPSVDWSSNGNDKDVLGSMIDFYRNKIKTNVYCFWLDPITIKPGEAKQKSDELHAKMLKYIERFERPRNE